MIRTNRERTTFTPTHVMIEYLVEREKSIKIVTIIGKNNEKHEGSINMCIFFFLYENKFDSSQWNYFQNRYFELKGKTRTMKRALVQQDGSWQVSKCSVFPSLSYTHLHWCIYIYMRKCVHTYTHKRRNSLVLRIGLDDGCAKKKKWRRRTRANVT